uniref:Uncharacterized protein n=1 Tax=Timema shepardi TaxID=629360 RepID=A0A7R9FZN8_TIMSH|nr:unnamed protein product [Timema shepardi]
MASLVLTDSLHLTYDSQHLGAVVKMEHFQAALDPRKQELLEARFLGARVSEWNVVLQMSGNILTLARYPGISLAISLAPIPVQWS